MGKKNYLHSVGKNKSKSSGSKKWWKERRKKKIFGALASDAISKCSVAGKEIKRFPRGKIAAPLSLSQIILSPMVFSLLTRLRYASRNRIRSTVPAPTMITNKSAHTPVITNPTGNIPSVLPGSTNTWFVAAAAGRPEEEGFGFGEGEEVDGDDDALVCTSSANMP